ncbi:MAG: sulfocyanin-like copper-binding protein [Acidimicrobiales bacterium]
MKVFVPAVALTVGVGIGALVVAVSGNASGPSDRQTPSSTSQRAPRSNSSGMMGSGRMGAGGMMGSGAAIANGAPGGLVPAGQMEALAATAAHAATRSGSVLTYHSRDVRLVALGAPGNRPGMYWQIDGVDGPNGPTVSVPAGATVTVDFADGDPGHPHGFELTTAAPPYNRMAMMQGRIAAPGSFIMPVPSPKDNQWYAATVSFQAPPPGTYHIVCPVPGHAQQGMWATFVVR